MPEENEGQQSCWEVLDAVVNHCDRLLLYGPPGTGKSHAAAMAGLGDRPVSTVTLTEEGSAAELRGFFAPGPDGLSWADGPAITAWRTGGRLIVDEIDHASPDVWSLLHRILDDAGLAAETLPSGETVRPARGFQVVATMNGEPADLPAALRDRFPVSLNIDTPHPGAIAALPDDLRAIAAGAAVADGSRRIGLRAWQGFATLREHVAPDMAGAAVFGEKWPQVEDSLRVAATPDAGVADDAPRLLNDRGEYFCPRCMDAADGCEICGRCIYCRNGESLSRADAACTCTPGDEVRMDSVTEDEDDD